MTGKSMTVGLHDDGNPPEVWFIRVTHTQKNGHHVFMSANLHGLFIADRDLKKAIAQIAPTIQTLILKSKQKKVSVVLGREFKEFELAHCSGDSMAQSENVPQETIVFIQAA